MVGSLPERPNVRTKKRKQPKDPSAAILQFKLEIAEERVVELKEEKKLLQAQVMHLQEALVAREAPVVYEDMRAKEAEAAQVELPPEMQKIIDHERKVQELMKQHAEWEEQPLFSDADDMMDKLAGAIGPPEAESVHGDSES